MCLPNITGNTAANPQTQAPHKHQASTPHICPKPRDMGASVQNGGRYLTRDPDGTPAQFVSELMVLC